MDAAVLISAMSAVVAAIALLLSVRQIGFLRRQNLSPVVLDAFREARTEEWFEAFDWIRADLAREHSPELGVSGLPEVARRVFARSASSTTTSASSWRPESFPRISCWASSVPE